MERLIDTEFYSFIGYQEDFQGGKVGLYNLKVSVPGHPKGSTVADITLIELGLVS